MKTGLLKRLEQMGIPYSDIAGKTRFEVKGVKFEIDHGREKITIRGLTDFETVRIIENI